MLLDGSKCTSRQTESRGLLNSIGKFREKLILGLMVFLLLSVVDNASAYYKQAIFFMSVADPDADQYLKVIDNDVLVKVYFLDSTSQSDGVWIDIVFTNEGGVGGVYTLNEVIAVINAQTQSRGYSSEGIYLNYDMADIYNNGDGTYSLKISPKFLSDSLAILYGNATATEDAILEGVFGDVSCTDSFTQLSTGAGYTDTYIIMQVVGGIFLADAGCDGKQFVSLQFDKPVAAIDQGVFLRVIDNAVTLKIQFTSTDGLYEDKIFVVFSNEGGTGGVYTLGQVISEINAQTQALGFSSEGIDKSYEMAGFIQTDAGLYYLTLKSRGASDGVRIECRNTVFGENASVEGVFGDFSCYATDSDLYISDYDPVANKEIYTVEAVCCGQYQLLGDPVPGNSIIFNWTARDAYDDYLIVNDADVTVSMQFTNSTGDDEEEVRIVFNHDYWGSYGYLQLNAYINHASQSLGGDKNYDISEVIENSDGTYSLRLVSRGESDGFILKVENAVAGEDASINGWLGDVSCALDDSSTQVDPSQYTASTRTGYYLNLNNLATIAHNWGADSPLGNGLINCDFDCSTKVDIGDLAIVARDWLTMLWEN